jgi:PAT family beta-lactamase induction signal transducer AmpG
MLPMFLAMHLPLLVLCCFHLPSVYYVYATVIAEQFDMVLVCCSSWCIWYISQKESQKITLCFSYRFHGIGNDATGHGYGFIQEYLGYGNFFIWVFIATIPGLILSRFLIFQRLWKEIRSNSEINVFQLVCKYDFRTCKSNFFFPPFSSMIPKKTLRLPKC